MISRFFLAVVVVATIAVNSSAQNIYKCTESNISFFAGTSVEDIDAVSTQASSFLNIETGEVAMSIPMNSFKFKESLMQEHFNENYVESEKYPKAEFSGKIENPTKVDWKQSSPVTVSVTGNLKIHGVSKPRTLTAQVTNRNGKLEVTSDFRIALEDHQIDRPRILWEKLAEEVDVKLKITYEVYKSNTTR